MNTTMTTTNDVQSKAIELLKKQLRTAQLCQDWQAVERIEKKIVEISSQQ